MLDDEPDQGAAPEGQTTDPAPASPEDGRVDPRVPFAGDPVQIKANGTSFSIRMRDLSCGGASGLCDEPLDVGDFVTVCFAKEKLAEAEVRWVRLLNVGLKFTHPLSPAFVRRLHQAHGSFVTTRPK